MITCGNNTRPKIVKISAMKNNVTPLNTSVTGMSFLTPATTKQFKPIGGVIKHTSAILTINDNADPSVRDDFETHFNHMVSENENYFTHIFEGTDDMTSHIKSSLIGSSISFPVSNGKPNFGTWQGIYLCEHRNSANSRRLMLTVIGE